MILAVLLILFGLGLYLYNIRTFRYWETRGIKYEKPIPFFGTNAKCYFMQRSTSQMVEHMYWKYPTERVVGTFRSTTPELVVRDPEIVKRILLTDFESFHKRKMFPVHEDVNQPLDRHLFNLDGDTWRLLRQRLTPAFSSGKLKAMFPLIIERAEELHTRIHASAGVPIDARDLMARFTTDFIGACAFGLNMDTLNEENSKFIQLGAKIFKMNTFQAFKFLLKEIGPETFKHINLKTRFESDVMFIVRTVLKQRNYQPSGRNDFVDLLLECQKKGKMVGESMQKSDSDGKPKQIEIELTNDLLAAQVFVFFAAGFETSSSTSSYTLHLLAYHPEKQKKVQDEIDRILVKHDNKLCYDAVKEMSYLEWAFKESMRILPSVGFLIRECARKYKFPDMDLTIDEGVKVMISVQALQNDPKYFENPKDFLPERFDPNNADSRNTKFVYLPFGDGPRACIGERLGLMQSIAGLASVLSKFTVEPAPTTIRFPEVDTSPGLVQTIKAGLPLIFRERKKEQ